MAKLSKKEKEAQEKVKQEEAARLAEEAALAEEKEKGITIDSNLLESSDATEDSEEPEVLVIKHIDEELELNDISKVDVERLNKKGLRYAEETKTKSIMIQESQARTMLRNRSNYTKMMEEANPKLAEMSMYDYLDLVAEKEPTKEELRYFMDKGFDWFQVNGTLHTNRGNMIGTSGMTVPTGKRYIVCTIKQFADIIACTEDGYNYGQHKASYEDKTNKTWYGKIINRYNLSRFLLDYCNGKVPRMDGKTSLTNEEKKAIKELAKEYEKFDPSTKKKTGRSTTDFKVKR